MVKKSDKNRVCPSCGRKYFTKTVKVYVFKRRYCPTCDKPMFSDNRKKLHICKKCGLQVDFADVRTVASMKVEMRGASRDIKVKWKNEGLGLEVVKEEVPKKRVCQACRNLRGKMEDIIRQKTRLTEKEIRGLSNEEVVRIFYQHVQKKLQGDLQKKKEEAGKIEEKEELTNP